MPMIYDLDNEYGGVILSDLGTGAPALRVNSNDPGQPAIAILSTASGSPIIVRTITAGNASVVPNGSLFESTAATSPALTVGRTVVGGITIAPLRIAHTSAASSAVLGFGGGFISVASILGIGVTGAAIAFDYVLPVELNGVMRGIPLTSLASLVTAAVF